MLKLMLVSLTGEYGKEMCIRAWADIICWGLLLAILICWGIIIYLLPHSNYLS